MSKIGIAAYGTTSFTKDDQKIETILHKSTNDLFQKTPNIDKKETNDIFEEFKKSGFKSNHELISDSMLNSLCIAGSPEEAKVQLEKFRNVGIDLPIIQFNPIGNTIESFSLLKKTLLDEA